MPYHPEQPDPDHDRVSLTEEQKLIFRSCIPLVEEAEFSPTDDFWDEVRAKESLMYRKNRVPFSPRYPGVNALKVWEQPSRIPGDTFDVTAYSGWHDIESVPLAGVRNCLIARYTQKNMDAADNGLAMLYDLNLKRRRLRVYPMVGRLAPNLITLANQGGLYTARERAKEHGFSLKCSETDAELILEQLALGAYRSN